MLWTCYAHVGDLLGTGCGHILDMLGPCWGHVWNMFWTCFEHIVNIMVTCCGHIKFISGTSEEICSHYGRTCHNKRSLCRLKGFSVLFLLCKPNRSVTSAWQVQTLSTELVLSVKPIYFSNH